ncbi:MAG: ABC transporter ATP-binding protein, partial [Nodosilinea sp.]
MNDITLLKRLQPLLRPYPWAMPAVVLVGMLASLFEGLGISLFIPVLQSLMPDAAPTAGGGLAQGLFRLVERIPAGDRLWVLPSLILACIVVKNLLSYSNYMLSAWLQNQISHRLRSQVHEQLLRVGYSYLENQNSGQLINTLAGETWRTGEAVAKLIGLITTICTTVVYTALLLLLSPTLTLVIAVVMGSISLLVRRIMRSVDRLGQRTVRANANLGMRMYEGLVGMRTIRAFGREDYEQARFEADSRQVKSAFVRLETLSSAVPPLYEVLSSLLVLVILAVAVRYDRAFVPALLTFLFMLYRLQPQMQMIESYRTS